MPAASYAWFGLGPVPVVQSPKFEAYEVITPSGSDDPLALNDALGSLVVLVNAAVGVPLAGWALCVATCARVST